MRRIAAQCTHMKSYQHFHPPIMRYLQTLCSLNFAKRCRSVQLGKATKRGTNPEVVWCMLNLCVIWTGVWVRAYLGFGVCRFCVTFNFCWWCSLLKHDTSICRWKLGSVWEWKLKKHALFYGTIIIETKYKHASANHLSAHHCRCSSSAQRMMSSNIKLNHCRANLNWSAEQKPRSDSFAFGLRFPGSISNEGEDFVYYL